MQRRNSAFRIAALGSGPAPPPGPPLPLPPPPPPKPASTAEPKKVVFSETYDKEIREIMDLAGKDRWEEAEVKAAALQQRDPKNPMLERIHTWVSQAGQRRREQALENKIRDIDSKNSVFTQTARSIIADKRDQGLPASKDIRDTVHRIENSPWIPDTYGKTSYEKGPLFDFDSAKGRMAKVLEKEITMHADNLPLENVLINLSQIAGVNIVADKAVPALKQQLSINLDKVKLGEFLRYVGRNYDLQFQVGDELVWVVDAKDPKRLMEETRFYRLRKGFVLPAQFGPEEVAKTTTTAGAVVTVAEQQKFKRFVKCILQVQIDPKCYVLGLYYPCQLGKSYFPIVQHYKSFHHHLC